MIVGMTSERVTVSLPSEMKEAAQRIATETGVPFSAVVNDALAAWLRARLVDSWLAEYQEEFGAFDEAELRQLAEEAGLPYIPPAQGRSAA